MSDWWNSAWYFPVAFGIWFASGLTCLWVAERYGGGEEGRAITVGEVLLFLVVGAPFLPLILGTLLCQVEIPRRRPPVKRTKPGYLVAAEAEVAQWLRERRDGPQQDAVAEDDR